MIRIFTKFAAVSTLGLCSIAAVAQEAEATVSETALQELVEGRVAGDAQRCVYTGIGSDRLRLEEGVGLVFERGDTLWVARARNADRITNWDIPVVRRSGSQLCREDVQQMVDRSTRQFSGNLFLEDWVPYIEIEEE